MIKRSVLIVLFICSIANVVFAADWVFLGKGEDRETYVDSDTIRFVREGNKINYDRIQCNIKMIFPKPLTNKHTLSQFDPVCGNNAKEATFIIWFTHFDGFERKLRAGATSCYGPGGAMLANQHSPIELEKWSPITPGTVGESMIKGVGAYVKANWSQVEENTGSANRNSYVP